MRRLALLVATALLIAAPDPATAQSDATRVYMMYFKVDFDDVPAWVDNYRRHEVPLLDSLVEEGTLLAYDLWVHDTGGEYNLRYNYVMPNWAAIGDFWDAYYARMGGDDMQTWLAMVQDHADEIWQISDSNIPAGRDPSPIIYESIFHVDYGGQGEWQADFAAHGRPALERAMEEGLIDAWAELHHDTGGSGNVRYVYWMDSWDAIDDALSGIGETRQELGQTVETGALIRAHSDDIWRTVPRGNGNQ